MKAPFYKSVKYAIEGIVVCIKKERNMKIHLIMMICVIIFGYLCHLN